MRNSKPNSRRETGSGWCLAIAIAIALPQLSPVVQVVEAQEIDRERQIPIAPAQGMVEIPARVRNALGLFPEIEGFVVARLLEQDDGDLVLELESRQAGELRRERRLLNDQALSELVDLITSRLADGGGAVLLDQEGRGRFVLGETLLGLAYRGWAVPATLDLDSGQAIVATYLLSAGASFYLPFRLTRDRSVTMAHRDLAMYGGTRGILAGILLGDASTDPDGSSADQVRFGAGLAASIAGSIAGFLIADTARPDVGTAALWRVMGDFGFMGGAATAYAAGPYEQRDITVRDGEFTYVRSETRNRALGHTLTVLGGMGGLVAGRAFGARETYTQGNASALRSAGILGAQVGVTAARIFSDEGRAAAGVGLVGGVAAILAGNRLLQDRRFSGGEGLLINAGHLGGGATALGLTYLFVEDVDEHELLYLTTSTFGSLLGAGFVYAAMGSGSDDTRAQIRGRETLTIHPQNLILAASELLRQAAPRKRSGARMSSPPSLPRARLPLINIRF